MINQKVKISKTCRDRLVSTDVVNYEEKKGELGRETIFILPWLKKWRRGVERR